MPLKVDQCVIFFLGINVSCLNKNVEFCQSFIRIFIFNLYIAFHDRQGKNPKIEIILITVEKRYVIEIMHQRGNNI